MSLQESPVGGLEKTCEEIKTRTWAHPVNLFFGKCREDDILRTALTRIS